MNKSKRENEKIRTEDIEFAKSLGLIEINPHSAEYMGYTEIKSREPFQDIVKNLAKANIKLQYGDCDLC
ncbi:MAG TPA: hypothetical protein PKY86_07980 [Niabella sp.]|nr:hypothetical protein [Niabella sp.]HQW14173.1 hypothetical protein [Niabella sp.]HQX19573.1 hypothetical protein [Niabella sp.]HQX39993.1 hypothetical protein [Niabella sp.]HRB06987.1 hypothetical protein [Niabella sp.]